MTNEIKGQGIVREVRHLLTYDCILRCKHCYLSAGEHPEVKERLFDQYEADRFYGFFKPESVSATGGEPLLRKDLVRILAKTTANYGGALELVTNGILLDAPFVRELTQLNPNSFYQISLDGSEEFHDALRMKKGAYKSAINAIDLVSQMGRIVKARMTVMPENYAQIPSMIETLDSLKNTNIKLVLRAALNTGRAETNSLGFGEDKIKELREFCNLPKFIKVSVTDRCGYCLDSITVDPAGDVYSCCYFVFDPTHKMGNMFNPAELKANREFVNFTGKCIAVEKFSKYSPKSRCGDCKTEGYLKPEGK